MALLSARTTRIAGIVIALSAAGLWALHAMDARADPPPFEDNSPCAKGALCLRRSSPISRRGSPPNPARRMPGDNSWAQCAHQLEKLTELAPRNLRAPSRLLGRTTETNGKACGRHASHVRRNGERLCGSHPT